MCKVHLEHAMGLFKLSQYDQSANRNLSHSAKELKEKLNVLATPKVQDSSNGYVRKQISANDIVNTTARSKY